MEAGLNRPSQGEKMTAALQIEYVETGSLIPYARNARTHTPEQVAQIAASIREFGWTNPVLLDQENGIVAGHGRVLAAAGRLSNAISKCAAEWASLPGSTAGQRTESFARVAQVYQDHGGSLA